MIRMAARMPLMDQTSICFSDNDPSKLALQQGFGKDSRAQHLLALLGSCVDARNHAPWWERATKQANISDAVSRADISLARELGWTELTFDGQASHSDLDQDTKSIDKTTGIGSTRKQFCAGHHGGRRPTWQTEHLLSRRGTETQKVSVT